MTVTPAIETWFRELTAGQDADRIEAGLARVSQILKETNVNPKAVEHVLEAEATSKFLNTELGDRMTSLDDYGPEATDAVCRILAEIFPTRRFDGDGILQSLSFEEEQRARDFFHEQGYLFMPHRLDSTSCDRIVEALGKVDFRVKATGEIVNGYHPDRVEQICGNTCWIIDHQDMLKIPEVQRLVSDPSILNLVQSYLGCTPVHDQVNCWWTINHQTTKKSLTSDAQLFHQDKDYLRFVKVFVYLNDVTVENGAHTYIRGSAKDYREHVPSNYKMRQRVDDEYLESSYEPDRFVSVVGEKGTIILEDTFGFHKGTPVQHGHRLLIQFEYCCSLYGGPDIWFSYEGLKPEYTRLAKTHPRMFLKYNNECYEQMIGRKHKRNASIAIQLKMKLRQMRKFLARIPQSLGLKKSA